MQNGKKESGEIMARCMMIKFTGEICNSVNQLNPMFFFNPETKDITVAYGCQHHTDELLRILLEEIKHQQKEQREIFSKLQKRKIAAKQYDIFFDSAGMFSELESIKGRINRIRWKFCRHPLCEKRNFFYDELVYSMLVFSTKGKLRHLFYFHKTCWQKIKAQCGFKAPWQTGQTTMDMIK